MSNLLPFIVAGLTAGAVYGLAGVGLVLTYKTSGLFNFAHGAVATVAAYAFFSLFQDQGWPWPLAAGAAIAGVGVLMALALERMARALQGSSLALRVASTVGLLLVIEAVLELLYDPDETRRVPVFLADGGVEISGVMVQWAEIITFVVAVLATAALSLFFRLSRAGLAMRAVVDDPDLLDLSGKSPTATRRAAWIVGVMFAATSGVLFAPLLPLEPVQLTLLVVAAFGAAAIGSFSSLPLTLVGGLVIGVLASLSTKWFTSGLLAGLPPSLPFVVLFLVLLVFPRRRLVGRTFELPRPPAWVPPASLQAGGGVILLVAMALVPAFAGLRLTAWTVAVATTIVFLSLALLVRISGQVSLAHVAFTAIGVAAMAQLSEAGVPWVPALVLAGLTAVPVGALLAIPAIRLTGLYLALATFGFGVLLQQMFYTQDFMFGANNESLTLPRPTLSWLDLDSDRGFYYVVLCLAALTALAVVALVRGRMGRLLRGMAESSTALETSGLSVNVTRILVFCISAFLAAVGGALAGVAQTAVSADAYPPLLSLTYFALIVIAFGGIPWSAVLAAGALVLVPAYVDGDNVGVWLQALFGAAAIAIATLSPRYREVPSSLRRTIEETFGRVRLPTLHIRRATPLTASHDPGGWDGELVVQNLTVRFGGLVAVSDLDLTARTGSITGLIGPNGAGKTTTFNACTGLVKPSTGRIVLNGKDITRSGPAVRARAGLGRTFQRMELFESLTVSENVGMGAEAPLAGANPLEHLAARSPEVTAVDQATRRALDICGIGDLGSTTVAALSTGQRRLVELARCLAGPYRILLLDEPSSGLDPIETKRFGEILKQVVRERGVGILLVEHDMSLVLDVCDDVYVLDFGRLVFHGTPGEVLASPIVQAAYLGTPEVEEAVGGAA